MNDLIKYDRYIVTLSKGKQNYRPCVIALPPPDAIFQKYLVGCTFSIYVKIMEIFRKYYMGGLGRGALGKSFEILGVFSLIFRQ